MPHVETLAEKRERIWRNKIATHGSAGPLPDGVARKPRRLRRQPAQSTRAKEIPELLPSDRNRLNRMIERKGPGECWPWLGAKSGFGYGRFKIEGRLFSPHRLIYADAHGPIENVQEHHGSVVMHTCDNPACCNPAHLRLGRQVANVADMIAKGRRGRTVPYASCFSPIRSEGA
jgi:hypothetical protein